MPARNYNGWLPANPAIYDAFVGSLIKTSKSRSTRKIRHHDAVQAFGDTIAQSPVMMDWFNGILNQSTILAPNMTDLDDFLHMLDTIIVAPPKFQVAEGAADEPIGVPMYLVFDTLSNTFAAHHLFCMPEFNEALKKLLNAWGAYLSDNEGTSNSSLNDQPGGWFHENAIAMLESEGRGKFELTYHMPTPDAPDRGYRTWDAFFTREFLPDARPLQRPSSGQPWEPERLIYNACESTVERWSYNVKTHDRFWLKGMRYSLYDMFNGDEAANPEQFEGGTVYQAFLSPQDYHRWHSPVSGKIVYSKVVPGTYYAVLPDKGVHDSEEEGKDDPRGGLIRSQPWLTMVATRAIFVIEAAEPIGRVALIGVGMAEVSTCEMTVTEGATVEAGQELGMFHFGGSSHALIFRPEANIRLLHDEGVIVEGNHLKLRSIIGVSVA